MSGFELFELGTVVIAQPKHPVFAGGSPWPRAALSSVNPKLVLSTVEDSPLGSVRPVTRTRHGFVDVTGSQFALMDTHESILLRIKVDTAFGGIGKVRFRFTDGSGSEVGAAVARGLVKTRELHLHVAEGRHLRLSRTTLVSKEWLLADAGHGPVSRATAVGRVTVGSVEQWRGRQRYVVEMGPGLEPAERRVVLASAVSLHLLRRVLGGDSAPG